GVLEVDEPDAIGSPTTLPPDDVGRVDVAENDAPLAAVERVEYDSPRLREGRAFRVRRRATGHMGQIPVDKQFALDRQRIAVEGWDRVPYTWGDVDLRCPFVAMYCGQKFSRSDIALAYRLAAAIENAFAAKVLDQQQPALEIRCVDFRGAEPLAA